MCCTPSKHPDSPKNHGTCRQRPMRCPKRGRVADARHIGHSAGRCYKDWHKAGLERPRMSGSGANVAPAKPPMSGDGTRAHVGELAHRCANRAPAAMHWVYSPPPSMAVEVSTIRPDRSLLHHMAHIVAHSGTEPDIPPPPLTHMDHVDHAGAAWGSGDEADTPGQSGARQGMSDGDVVGQTGQTDPGLLKIVGMGWDETPNKFAIELARTVTV